MVNQDHLEKLINDFDQGRLPQVKDEEGRDYIKLIQDLKIASLAGLEPDPEFVNQLEVKLTKGGERFMAKWQKIFLGLGVGVVVLLALVNPGFMLPTPLQVFNKGMGTTVLPTEPEQVTGGQGGKAETLEKKMIAPSDLRVMPYPDTGIVPPYGEDLTSPERYLVRSASLSLEVKDVSAAVDEATKYVVSIGGLVTNSSVNKGETGYYGYLTARVPEKEFTTVLQYFKRMALSVEAENVSAYDETGQVTGTEERKQELERQLEKYKTLLQQAQTAEEKLRIQQQIDRLEQQIKAVEKQIENLKSQAAMSQITVNFQEKRFKLPLVGKLGLEQTTREAIEALKRVVAALVLLAIWVVVFAPIWLPIVLIIKWLKKRK